MKDNKKYYWLKLKEDFFDEKYIKALRKLPDGDALTIVYLKMQLKSLKTEGIIQYDHILPSAEEELALVLDEDVNIVRLTLSAIVNMGLVEQWENDTLYMVAMQNLIGSETAVAERVRKHREKQKLLQCNTEVTNGNTYIEIEKKEKSKEINKEKKERKKSYGEYENVKLLDKEYQSLISDYGSSFTDEIIKYLDEYIEMKGAKYKSCYMAIRKWVVNAVKEKNQKSNKSSVRKEIVPEWMDKDIEKNEPTEDDLKVFDELDEVLVDRVERLKERLGTK